MAKYFIAVHGFGKIIMLWQGFSFRRWNDKYAELKKKYPKAKKFKKMVSMNYFLGSATEE